uniref:Uncharacterized protein n=1 Tax=Xenopus tropicalis TaxID=8364 RepID=A0A1B8Y5H0_XENTR
MKNLIGRENLIGRDTNVWCKEGLRTALPTKRGSWCHSAFRGLKNVLKCIQLNVKVAT